MSENLALKVLEWTAGDDVGISSQCMAFVSCGVKPKYKCTPSDPADLNRCLKLVKQIPEIKDKFDQISKISNHWKSVIDNWDLLEKTFIDEVGFDWCNGRRAPETYKLMKELEKKVKTT